MAICNRCGGQLAAGERFCGSCGADQLAAGGAPVAAPLAAPVAAQQMPYVAPTSVPMSVAMPPPAAAKKSGMMWLGIIAAAAAGYYYYTNYMQKAGTAPPGGPAPQGVPGPQVPEPQAPGPQVPQGQPGQNPGGYPGQQPAGYPGQQPGQNPGGYPGQQPAQQPGGNPGQQPGGPAQPGGGGANPNQALVVQQQFQWKGAPQDGYLVITQSAWKNGSTVTIQSANLACAQLNAQKQMLTASQMTLNGPLAPGQSMTFPQFKMGQLAQGVANVECAIIAVTPAAQ